MCRAVKQRVGSRDKSWPQHKWALEERPCIDLPVLAYENISQSCAGCEATSIFSGLLLGQRGGQDGKCFCRRRGCQPHSLPRQARSRFQHRAPEADLLLCKAGASSGRRHVPGGQLEGHGAAPNPRPGSSSLLTAPGFGAWAPDSPSTQRQARSHTGVRPGTRARCRPGAGSLGLCRCGAGTAPRCCPHGAQSTAGAKNTRALPSREEPRADCSILGVGAAQPPGEVRGSAVVSGPGAKQDERLRSPAPWLRSAAGLWWWLCRTASTPSTAHCSRGSCLQASARAPRLRAPPARLLCAPAGLLPPVVSAAPPLLQQSHVCRAGLLESLLPSPRAQLPASRVSWELGHPPRGRPPSCPLGASCQRLHVAAGPREAPWHGDRAGSGQVKAELQRGSPCSQRPGPCHPGGSVGCWRLPRAVGIVGPHSSTLGAPRCPTELPGTPQGAEGAAPGPAWALTGCWGVPWVQGEAWGLPAEP